MTDNPAPRCVYLQAYDWREATLALSLPRMSFAEVVDVARGETLARTVEQSAVTRVRLADLKPDTAYELEVRWDGGERRVAFRTLPAPEGELRASFVAMADPHVSEKTENRKGRLFVESASILRDLVEDANALGVDGIFLAGDVTNAGTAWEFDRAKRVLAELRCPLFAAPGDHDVGKAGEALWRTHFGETSRVGEMSGLTAVVLNTAAGFLGEDGRRRIEEALALGRRGVIVVSHAQLYEDDYIRAGKRKGIGDSDECAEALEALSRHTTLIYAGHQNIASRVERGGLMQLNLPQTLQYPCGYVLVREYANGFYHTYRPIRSVELDEASRVASNAAAAHYGEAQWEEAYRLGRDPGQANFLIDPEPEGEVNP